MRSDAGRETARWRAMVHGAAAGRRILLDAVLPPRCLACGAAVDRTGTVCPHCWQGLTFLGPPLCSRCGLPFEVPAEAETVCGACIRRPPVFGKARAALAYDDASRRLLLAFKHGDAIHAADAYGAWLFRASAELVADADLIAPVPLHRWRLLRRRYNQAALLARRLAAFGGAELCVDLLRRQRQTPSQGRLGLDARRRNVRGAFVVSPGRAARVRGRRIVLVDDVYTTGATVDECARTLLKAGAVSVDVATLARVVRTQPS